MYNSTFQVSYRRKVYEEVATLAYQRMNKEAFKWLPDWIVSVTGGNDAKEDIFSDLDYAAELCSAALGMNRAGISISWLTRPRWNRRMIRQLPWSVC